MGKPGARVDVRPRSPVSIIPDVGTHAEIMNQLLQRFDTVQHALPIPNRVLASDFASILLMC